MTSKHLEPRGARCKALVGIDPGFTGGLSAISPMGNFLTGIRMPIVVSGKRKLIDGNAIDNWAAQFDIQHVTIEAPNSMPRQGLQSTFNFGRACGAVETWAVTIGCPVTLVTPSIWKKALKLTPDKQASLDKARLLFGAHELWHVKANDGIAEAALIAYWEGFER